MSDTPTKNRRDAQPTPNERIETTAAVLEGLSPTQTKVLELMMAGESITAATRAAGVWQKTYYHWLRDSPAFREARDALLAALRENTATAIVQAAESALTSIVALATGAADEGVRLKAAVEILQRLDGAQKHGSASTPSAQVVIQLTPQEVAAELRKRREEQS